MHHRHRHSVSCSRVEWTETVNQTIVDMGCSRLLLLTCFKAYETFGLKMYCDTEQALGGPKVDDPARCL